MYKQGQKLYKLEKWSGKVITFTYVCQDQGTLDYMLKDQGGQYQKMKSLNEFSDHPDLCQLDLFRKKIRSFKKEKHQIARNIERYKEEVKRYQKIIKKEVARLQKCDKKIGGVSRHFDYLKDTYPEEFI